MKTPIIFTITLLYSIICLAQTGINYKAILYDDVGNPISESLVVVQFSIYEGSPTGTLVYQEDHTPTTDLDGLVILNMGLGNASSGVFEDINWTNADHFLNVQVNTGAGLVDLGTTQFMAVPLALSAETAVSALNVSGLEVLDEGNGIGWRLIGKDPENYGAIGLHAIDLTQTLSANIQGGALGVRSFAFGLDAIASDNTAIALGNRAQATAANAVSIGSGTEASGFGAMALGSGTEASGFLSTAMGFQTVSSGFYTTAMGRDSEAVGTYSTSMGYGTRAQAYASLVLGRYNVVDGDSLVWNTDDQIFVIGDGDSDTQRSNSLTVLKNGNVGIGISNPTNTLQMLGRFQLGSIEFMEDGGLNQIALGASWRPTFDDTYRLGNADFRWRDVWAIDGTINTSDGRDKTNIEALDYGLDQILQLKPVSFNWKNRASEEKKLGLIAQDLQQVIPEVVKSRDWQATSETDPTKKQLVELERLGVYYSDLIPVLIKAIQEQHQLINNQQSQLDKKDSDYLELRSELDHLKSVIHHHLPSKPILENRKE